MSNQIKLSDQQYAIISVLWDKQSASAKEVQEQLIEHGWAHTTIGTVLSRLEKKGILSSEAKGRERYYRPLIQESDVKRSMVSGLVSSIFRGDPKALLAHMLKEGDLDKDDLSDLKSLFEEKDQ